MLFRMVHGRELIHGDWWQIFEIVPGPRPDGSPGLIQDRFRYGSCRIVQKEAEVSISAESWRLDESLSSSWRSELADYSRGRLLILFLSESSSNERGPTRGTMHLTVYDQPPQRIVGTFADGTPARNSGVMYIMKNKERWESIVEELRASRRIAAQVTINPDVGTVHVEPVPAASGD